MAIKSSGKINLVKLDEDRNKLTQVAAPELQKPVVELAPTKTFEPAKQNTVKQAPVQTTITPAPEPQAAVKTAEPAAPALLPMELKDKIESGNHAMNVFKTAYQENLAEEKAQAERPVFDTESFSGAMGDALVTTINNPEAGAIKQNALVQQISDPSSDFYQPYIQPTNAFFHDEDGNYLNAIGISTDNIDDQWFEDNKWLTNYYDRRGTSNTPSAPTKKSTTYQRAAYQYYQLSTARETTNAAQTEFAALQEEIAFWAGRDDMNLSDGQIKDKIEQDFRKKYPTLNKMEESREIGENLIELNQAVPYSSDILDGMIWAARNGGGSGNVFQDSAWSSTGYGNTWQENKRVTGKLDPGSENYNPFSVSSTMYDEQMYFGKTSFTSEEIANMARDGSVDWNDKTSVDYYNNLVQADQFTTEAEKEAAELRKKVSDWLGHFDYDEKNILNLLDFYYDNCDALKKLDQAMDVTSGHYTELASTTRPIDWKKSDLETYIQECVVRRDERKARRDAAATVNSLVEDTVADQTITIPGATVTTPAPTPTPTPGPLPTPGPEPAPAVTPTPAPPAADASATPAPGQTGTAKLKTPTNASRFTDGKGQTLRASTGTSDVTPFRKLTDEEAEQIRNADKKTLDGVATVGKEAGEAESNIWSFAPSAIYDTVKNVTKNALLDNVNNTVNQKVAKGVAQNYFENSLENIYDVANYKNRAAKQAEYDARYANYQAQFGDVTYYEKKFEPQKVVEQQEQDGTTTVVSLMYNEDADKYEVYNISNAGRNMLSIDEYEWMAEDMGNDAAAQAIDMAKDLAVQETIEAQKIRRAQDYKASLKKVGITDLDAYVSLDVARKDNGRWLEEHAGEFEEKNAALAKGVKTLDNAATFLTWMNGNTDTLEQADDMVRYLSQYYDQPQLPTSGETQSQFYDAIAELYGDQVAMTKGQFAKSGMASIDNQLADIEKYGKMLEQSGYAVPDKIKRNMEYKRQDLEHYRKEYEYIDMMESVPEDEKQRAISAAKDFEAKWGSNAEASVWEQTVHDNASRNMYNFGTPEEQDTYYYLLGRKILEYGDEFERLMRNPGKDPNEMVAIVENIIGDANDYDTYMNDPDYGAWTAREREAMEEGARKRVLSGFWEGTAENVGATLLTPLESIMSILYAGEVALTGKRFNSNRLSISNYKNAVREATREAIDGEFENNPIAKTLANLGYEIYCSRGDSFMNQLAFGSLVKIDNPILNEIVGASPMGATAALSAAANAVEAGADMSDAWLLAGITFVAETASEGITYGNIKEAMGAAEDLTADTLKGFVKHWLTSSGVEEAIGETATEIAEKIADQRIMGDNSQFNMRVSGYEAQGYGYEEAREKAARDEFMDIVHTAVVSYLSPGADVFTQIAASAVNGVSNAIDAADYYLSATRDLQRAGFSVSTLDVIRAAKENEKAARGSMPIMDMTPVARESTAAPAIPSGPADVVLEARQQIPEEDVQKLAAAKAATRPAQTETAAIPGSPAPVALEATERVPGADEQAMANAKAEARPAQEEVIPVIPSGPKDLALEARRQDLTTDEQKLQAAKEAMALERMREADNSSQTAALAAVLETSENTDETGDRVNAAAAYLQATFGDKLYDTVENVLMGAARRHINPDVVKMAMQTAGLSKNSQAYAVMTSEAFQVANDLEQAEMLAETFQPDSLNPTVASDVGETIYETRIAIAEKELMANGAMDQASQAEDELHNNLLEHWDAQKQQDKASQKKATKADALNVAKEEVLNNPTADAVKNYEHAVTELNAASEMEQQAIAHTENTQQKLANQQQIVDDLRTENHKAMRQQSIAAIGEQDNQRAAARQAQQEAELAAAKAAAQAQAEEDIRTGKAQEESDNAAIDAFADSFNIDDETRARLKNRAEQFRANKVDMSGKLTTSEGMLALGALSRKLGVQILGTDNLARGIRAKYQNGTIYLNNAMVNSGEITTGQALVEASLHEITHAMENTKNYEKYDKVVIDYLYGKDQNRLKAAIRAKQNEYMKVGTELSDTEARQEIVADFARTYLNQKDVVNRFMDAGMGGSMRNTLHNINQGLKNFVARMKGEDRTTAEYLRRAERSFQKAMNEYAKQSVHPDGDQFSVAQFAAASGLDMIADEDSLALYIASPDGKKVDGLDPNKRYRQVDGDKVRITPDMMTNTPVGMLIDMGLSDQGLTDNDGKPLMDENGNQRTQKGDAKKMFADLMNLVAKYRDNNLIWEIAGSEFASAFSSLKSNSDPQYKTTVDFGTICSKTQAIIDVLSGTMTRYVKQFNAENEEIRAWNKAHPDDQKEEKIFTGLTREGILEVYNQTHDADLSVPCPVCYVFSRWMGVPSLLGQMNKFQHEFVVTQKDADGNTINGENGRPVIDKEATQEKANAYINNALEKYGSKEGIDNVKTKLQNKINNRADALPKLKNTVRDLELQLADNALTAAQRKSLESKLNTAKNKVEKNVRETDQFTADLEEVEAFNWVTQALCLQERDGKKTVNVLDENGNYVVDDLFQITPEEILFDLNRTGEFAGDIKNWRYRTTRGAGMGKSIMPYSGAEIGDIINGDAKRWAAEQNPFKQMDLKEATAAFERAKKRTKQQNLVGGQRLQSTSDFRPEWGLDYVMSFLELQALGSKVQMYTKVAEAVDFLGTIGADENLSIMPLGDGYHEATAAEIEEAKTNEELSSRMGTVDGKTYVMDFSDATGMEYNTAKGKTKKFNNAQMILVGINDIHIKLALGNKDIDFVIPWHSSGNSKDVLKQLVSTFDEELNSSSDYTDFQTDTKKKNRTEAQKSLWDARVKLLTEGGNKLTEAEINALLSNPMTADLYSRFTEKGVDDDCYGVTLPKAQAEQIFPYEYWDKTSTRENADVNGKRFAEYCEALGLTPRFAKFKNVPGYWKLLIDRKMYDNNTLDENGNVVEYGKYREQNVVDVTKATIDQLPSSTTAKYGNGAATNTAIENSMAALDKKYDVTGRYSAYGEVTDADLDQMLHDALTDYQDAVDRGDMEAAQEDVDFYAEQNGYTYNAFHGSPVTNITSFDKNKLGSNTGSTDIPGFFFVNRRDYAESYLAEEWNIKPEYKERYEEAQAIYNQYHDQFSHSNGYFEIGDRYGEYVQRKQPERFKGFYDPESQEYKDFERARIFLKSVDDDQLKFKPQYTDINKQGKVYDVKLKIQNPYIYDANGEAWTPSFWGKIKQAAESEGGFTYNGGTYDGIIVENFYDFDTGESGTEYVVFNPEQIKSADPVTYDNNGNVIPLDQRFTNSSDIRYSSGGETTDADLDLMLSQAGIITQEDIDQYNQKTSRPLEGKSGKWRQADGPAQRQFGSDHGMLQDSDEIDPAVVAFVQRNNAYFPDTNANQITRAINWIRQNGSTKNDDGTYTRTSDGFNESLEKVMGKGFDYRSADGQARMIAVMAMAAAKANSDSEDSRSLGIKAQVELADAFNRQGTDLGRMLQARKIFRLMTPEGRISTLQKMLKTTQDELEQNGITRDLKFSEWLYQAAAAATEEGDFEKVQQAAAAELGAQLPSSWKDKIRGWRMLSMLGNPRTHIRNVVGNAMFIPMVGIKNKIGAVMELGLKPGERTKTLGLSSPEARAFAKSYVDTVSAELRGEAKYDDKNAIQREVKTWGTGNGLVSKTLGKMLQAASDFNGNALEWEDWLFLKGHFKRALSGYMTANHYTAADMTGSVLEKATQYAITEAHKATYRDANSVADALNSFSKKARGTKMEKGAEALQFVVDAILPFKKTPANILRRGIEYSPIGLVSAATDIKAMIQTVRHQNDESKPAPKRKVTPAQLIDKFASALTGTGVLALGAILGAMGAANAGFDDDDPEDKLKKLKGEQEYGVNFGKILNEITNAIAGVELFGEDVTRTMDWAAPFSMPFFVGVALEKQLEKENGDLGSILNAILGVTEPVFNLSMLDGINSLFNVTQNDPMNPATQIGMKILLNYGTSFVPTLLGQVARIVDPTRRATFVQSGSKPYQVYSTVEQVQNKIPGLSEQNIPYRNAFGEAEKNGSALETMLAPWYRKDIRSDELTKEIENVFNDTHGSVPGIIPSLPSKSFQVGKGEWIKPTAEEYEQMQVVTGQTGTDLLNDLIHTDEYIIASPESRAAMMEYAWKYANKKGKQSIAPSVSMSGSDAWMATGEKKGDMVKAIIDKVIAENQTGYVEGKVADMIDYLNVNDIEAAQAIIADLKDNAKVEPAKIRDKVSDYFRPLYYDAWAKGDDGDGIMSEIKDIMMSFDIGYDKNTFSNWNSQAKKKYVTDTEEEDNPTDLSSWLDLNNY